MLFWNGQKFPQTHSKILWEAFPEEWQLLWLQRGDQFHIDAYGFRMGRHKSACGCNGQVSHFYCPYSVRCFVNVCLGGAGGTWLGGVGPGGAAWPGAAGVPVIPQTGLPVGGARGKASKVPGVGIPGLYQRGLVPAQGLGGWGTVPGVVTGAELQPQGTGQLGQGIYGATGGRDAFLRQPGIFSGYPLTSPKIQGVGALSLAKAQAKAAKYGGIPGGYPGGLKALKYGPGGVAGGFGIPGAVPGLGYGFGAGLVPGAGAVPGVAGVPGSVGIPQIGFGVGPGGYGGGGKPPKPGYGGGVKPPKPGVPAVGEGVLGGIGVDRISSTASGGTATRVPGTTGAPLVDGGNPAKGPTQAPGETKILGATATVVAHTAPSPSAGGVVAGTELLSLDVGAGVIQPSAGTSISTGAGPGVSPGAAAGPGSGTESLPRAKPLKSPAEGSEGTASSQKEAKNNGLRGLLGGSSYGEGSGCQGRSCGRRK
nr:elastin-like [Paramormyrops kingsleyae]